MSVVELDLPEAGGKLEITRSQYELVRQLVYDRAGINLGENRQHLVQARLAKRIRVQKLKSFDEYFEKLKNDKSGAEIGNLIDAISTNTTHFFREPDHFDFLVESVEERIAREKWETRQYTLRVWSAASSSGEEPYSLAMTLDRVLERYPSVSLKILATDISQSVLARAKQGRYDKEKVKSISAECRNRYFKPVPNSSPPMMEVIPRLKNLVTFGQFNLMAPSYPFRHGFDYIFCRNVMIYFDQTTQQEVIRKMSGHVRSGGYFIVGHSESLNSIRHDLKYVRPTIYYKR